MPTKLTPAHRSAITLIRQEATRLDITLPASADTTPAPLTIASPSRDEITTAVTKALETGKDPGKDPAVQALVTRAYLAGLPEVSHALEAKRDQELLEAFHGATEAIKDQMAELFAEAADTLEANKAAVGAAPLDQLNPGNMTPTAGRAALEIIEATKRIDQINGMWSTIHHTLNNAWLNPYAHALRMGNPTFQQWQDNRLRGAKPTAWELVCMGVELNLADSPDEVAARFQSLEESEAQYERDAEEFSRFGYGGRAAHIAGNQMALDNLHRTH